ncbi:MAG: DUF4249 family protein [Bacteroidales bacterium]
MNKIITLLLGVTLITSCIEDYDLNIADNGGSRLVVEGAINNKPGPYFVQLTKSRLDIGTTEGADYYIADATVILSDDENNIDTLEYIDFDETGYKIELSDFDTTTAMYNGYYLYKPVFDEYGNAIDTLFISSDIYECNRRGFYATSDNFIGREGHTYYLKVIWENKVYEATAYMKAVPDIEVFSYEMTVSEKDGQIYYVPIISFQEPQNVTNYYLIMQNKESYYRRINGDTWQGKMTNWDLSIFSDVHMESDVENLNVSLGYNPRGIEYPMYSVGEQMYISLNSLSLVEYNFYKALIDQFENDGGAFKPAPASPPGNISNGALGLFRASAVSEASVIIQ